MKFYAYCYMSQWHDRIGWVKVDEGRKMATCGTLAEADVFTEEGSKKLEERYVALKDRELWTLVEVEV